MKCLVKMVKKQKKLRICKECGRYITTYTTSKELCSKCYYKKKGSRWHKKYYLKNKERIKKRINNWRKNNPEEEYLRQKIYREKNKESIRKKKKEYRKKNKDIIREKKKTYQKENWYWIKKHKLHYFNNRKKYDIKFRIQCNLRLRLYKAIKGINKSKSSIELIGCSVEYLLNYLESQFDDEMSWTNYGKWEIDHIKPCAKFDLSKEKEQRECFNYSNLQPLWRMDNMMKGATYES